MINISKSVAQQISEEWKSLPISVDQAQFKQFELLPIYLREHIWLQVQEHFKVSIRPANENWIQWEDAQLKQKWEDFLQVAAQIIQVPREDVIKLGQEFVQIWVPILVEPAKHLVDWLYGEKVELKAEELEARCEELLFFPELKHLIPLYLQRKDLHILSKVRASQIIQQLYTKLVEKYDWDRWERELETFYQICCRTDIPSEWLVRYFDDRGLTTWSQKLPEAELSVNQLLDVLKSTDRQALPNQPQLDQAEDENNEPEESQLDQAEPIVLVAEEHDEPEDSLHPDSLASLFMNSESSFPADDDPASEETTLMDSTQDDRDPEANEEELHPKKEEGILGNDDWLTQEPIKSTSSNQSSVSEELSGMFDDDDNLFNRPIKKTEEAESTQELLNEELSSSFFEDSNNTVGGAVQDSQMPWQIEDEDEPVVGMTRGGDKAEPEYHLARALKKNRKKYIKKLFNGSKEDYLEVLEKLESKFIWPKVVHCLQHEVIPGYDIDMTTKVMVQFTDELEKYFND